ncbi:MAG: nucleoside triphosphate pyrophosphohydrolase, partial [Clostridiales bacterium]|nr:nucleoside triphosphate pyrophosphohydrolase [Clostridiales bacterium]
YEVVEAINRSDTELLREELGDVLLQVVFHSQMAREAGTFDFDQVADGICKKLIVRHPHVFADATAETADAVLENWENIKNRTKHRDTHTQSMESVPKELPALMRAEKVQKRAKKAGFDWPDSGGALDKLDEELAELRQAVSGSDAQQTAEEFGDLLFSMVNVSRFLGVSAEETLQNATNKFIARFSQVEALARARGVDMQSADLEALDALWDEVKQGNSSELSHQ